MARGFRIGHPRHYRIFCDQGSYTLTGSDVSFSVQSATDTTAPTVPTGLSASVVGSNSIVLSWTASADASGISQYRVERSLTGTSGWSQVGTSVTTSYTDSGLSYSTTYYYRIIAVDGATPANVSAASGSASATTSAVGALWSSPTTWASGAVPIAGEDVTIPAGQTVTLDVETPSLGSLDILGTLQVVGSGTYALTVEQAHIEGDGALLVGASDSFFTGLFTMTFTGARSIPANAHDRGMMIHDNGRLEVYATSPSPTWTKLNASATAGATTLTVKDSLTNWRSGDQIVLGSTDFYYLSQTETATLASAGSGTSLTVTSGLTYPHYGVIQYATNSGLSLTPGSTSTFPASVPTTLDERGPVGNLTRRVIFQSIADSEWTNSEYGFHIMIMDLTCRVYIDGAKFLRGGQSGSVGRYPIHWHLCSWTKSGVYAVAPYLGEYDPGDAVIKNSVVQDSGQRGVVIHSTDGVQVEDNIIYNCKGHGYFLEDGTEQDNVFDGNLAIKVRAPVVARNISAHELDGGAEAEGGSSGFWLTNPDNTVTNNHACDCAGAGIWGSFSEDPLGLSQAVPIEPYRVRLGTWSNNTCHSNQGANFLLRGTVIDPWLGTISLALIYQPTTTDATGGSNAPFTISNFTLFKGNNGAYKNRVHTPTYDGFVTADNYGTDFVGSTLGGELMNSLIIGYSLNNANPNRGAPLPYYSDTIQRSGVATYHSSIAIHDNVFMHFPEVISNNYGSGAFKADDLYTDAVEMGNYRNDGNVLIDSFPGYRTLPPNLLGAAYQVSGRNFTYAGAYLDYNGYWGQANTWWVFDVPFLTSGAAIVADVSPNDPSPFSDDSIKTNGVYVDTEQFYGVQNYYTNFDPSEYAFSSHILVTRQDSGGSTIDTWEVPDGNFLSNMRHFSAAKDGRYLLEFPDHSPPTLFRATILNCYRAGDSFLFGFEFAGGTTITTAYYAAGGSQYTGASRRTLSAAANLAAVSAGAGQYYWQDTANNRLWVKVMGGLTYPLTPTAGSDTDLHRPTRLVIN